MTPRTRRILWACAAGIGGSLYVLYVGAVAAAGEFPSDPVRAFAVGIAALPLMLVWVWFLTRARRTRDPRVRTRLQLGAVLMVVVLAATAAETDVGPLLAPWIVLTAAITALTVFSRWRAVLVLGLLAIAAVTVVPYFGLVLIAIGLCGVPSRPSTYFRTLFPPSVGGS